MDKLNAHVPAALYEACASRHARAILARVAFHHTPKHGSWLNIAESEISVFARGRLSRPVGTLSTVRARVAVLETERNAAQSASRRQCASQQARITLAGLSPVTQIRLTGG